MRLRNPFLPTKSDLLFAALLALAIWLGICWHVGSTKHWLGCRLEERLRISGVVRTTEPSLPEFDFAYSSHRVSGGGGGPYYSDRETRSAVAEYDLMLLRSWATGYYWSGEWRQREDNGFNGSINLSVQLPAGWHAEPPNYTISGPRSDADFDLIRETQ